MTRDAEVREASSGDAGLPVIGVISTWNSQCGIAAYTRSLMSGIAPKRLRVFASKVAAVLDADESFVSRCWIEGWDDPLDELFQAVQAAHVDAVVIQFNFGLFRPAALKQLLDRLHAAGIPVFMTLHATMDVNHPGMTASLRDIRTALAKVRRLLVHSVHDLNRLQDIGLLENVTLFPMGVPLPFQVDRAEMRRSLGLDDKTVVASFGYLLPNKGLPELIHAFALLRGKCPDAHLLMLNALYPMAPSIHERDKCLNEIHRLDLTRCVTLVTDFLDEASALACLAAADIVVCPYQHIGERGGKDGSRLRYPGRRDSLANLRRRRGGESCPARHRAGRNRGGSGKPAFRSVPPGRSRRTPARLGRRA
jgi:glycosyltransferase involved in cell wall biosynthesis